MTTISTDVQHLDPTTLLTDINVRADLRLDPQFVASIREHGVLVPIVATHSPDGIRVRMGHRRTRAAVEAGLTTVPVVIVATDAEGDAAEIERLLSQHAENHHRAGLTSGETAAVAQQLSLLGLSAHQIAKRTHTKRETVDTALKVGASPLASKATDRYDLTLDQAAVVAEFEEDTDTVKALIAAAATGQFEHIAEQARQARAAAIAQAPLRASLTEAGITILDAAPSWHDTIQSLDRLRDGEGQRLDPTEHTTCPGHAVFLTDREVYTEPDGTVLDVNRWGDVTWPEDNEPDTEEAATERWEKVTVTTVWEADPACTDPAAHGHLTDSQWWDRSSKPTPAAQKSDAERAAAAAQRRLVIENNKAWKAARIVRREWIGTYLTRKTLPTHAGPFIAAALAARPDLVADTAANRIAAEWFNVEPADYGRSNDLADAVEAANDKRALVMVLGLVLAGYEARATDTAWRENGDHSPTGHYLRYLAASGYALSDVETYAASSETA